MHPTFDVVQGKDAVEAYEEVKQQRHERFMAMFKHVSKCIDGIYKQLTRSKKHPTVGLVPCHVCRWVTCSVWYESCNSCFLVNCLSCVHLVPSG